MNLLKTIIERLNQRVEVANIFDKQFNLCELNANGNDKAWVHYIGNGQAEVVTNFDAKNGTLFWAKRGKVSVAKTEAYKMSGCKQLYVTTFPLTAYAIVRKSHLPCDAEDAQDWLASRVYKLTSGTDPLFKQSIGVINYEVVPTGYANEIKSLTANYEWACVSVDMDVQVITTSEDGCYDTCATGDIPLPDLPACVPCLTEVAVDGVTITGNGTTADPLVALGGGGGTPLITKNENTNVSTNTSTLNFTGAGVTASLTSPGVVEVNVPGGSGVTSVGGTAPIASSGGTTPDISISQASTSVDGYLSSTDWNTFDGKFDVPTGTATDYLDGTGTPTPFPTIPVVTGFVPYTGATADLDMGTHNITADHIALNVSPSGAGFVVGATEWNNTIGSSQTLLKGGNVILKNGVDLVARIVNKVTPNTTLTKAAYQAVRVSGAAGQRLAVELAQANNDNNSADTIGLVTETITTNQEGFIMTVGQLLDINTTGSLQGETWADGDVLYLSPTTAGRLTNIKPTGATGHIVVMGYVEYAHASNGAIYVKVMNGWELGELHDVSITTPANNDALIYESSTQLWKNKTIATALGFTPVTNARTITINGTAQDLSANRSWTIATPTIYKSTTDAGAFSSIVNTAVYTQLIAANTYAIGDIIRVNFRARKTGTAGIQTLRIYVNSTADLSGTPLLVGQYRGIANNTIFQMQRHLVIKSSTANTEVFSTATTGSFTDFAQDVPSTIVIDWTATKYFVFALQNASALDTNFGSMYLIEKL